MKSTNSKLLILTIVMLVFAVPISTSFGATAFLINDEPSGTYNVGLSEDIILVWNATITGSGTFDFAISSDHFAGWTYNGADASINGTPVAIEDNPTFGGIARKWNNTLNAGNFVLTANFTAPATPSAGIAWDGGASYTTTAGPTVDNWAITVNVVAIYGVSLTPTTSTERILLGENVTHTINVNNTGNDADTFTLAYGGNGTAEYSVNPVPLAAGANVNITLTLSDLTAWTHGGVLNATSDTDGSKLDTAVIVSEVHGANVSLAALTSNPKIGAVASEMNHTVQVTNLGNFEDYFNLSITVGDAVVSEPWVGPLAPGASTTVTVTEPTPGVEQIETATIRAASYANSSILVDLVLSSDFRDYGVTITPNPSNISIRSGQNAVHTFNVTNIGGIEDTFDLVVNGTGVLSTATTGALAPGAVEVVTLTYTSPASGRYVANITGISQGAGVTGEAMAYTKVASYGVTITPATSEDIVLLGGDASHLFLITNTGSDRDVFSVNTTGAGVLNGTTVVLNSGASAVVELSLVAPAAGNHTETVMVASTLDPMLSVSDTSVANTDVYSYASSVTCLTTPLTIRSGQNGVHTFNVTNLANVNDHFTVTYVGVPAGTLSAATISLGPNEWGLVTITYTNPAEGLGQVGTVNITSTLAPIIGGVSTDEATATTHVKTYGVTVVDEKDKTLSETVTLEGGNTVHTFTVNNTGNDVDDFTIVLTGDGVLNINTTNLASGVTDTFTVTHNTTTAGIYSSTVVVTSDGYGQATATVRAKSFAVVAANHTQSAVNGVSMVNSTLKTGLMLTANTTAAVTVDIYKLPGNPRPEKSLSVDNALSFLTITVDDKSLVTSIDVSVVYRADEFEDNGLDTDTLSVYYWNEVKWKMLSNVDIDIGRQLVNFTIPNTAWLDRSYDFDFVVTVDEETIRISPPTPPVTPPPDVEIPDDATSEEIGDAITDVITDDTTTEQIADIITDNTEESTNEEVADIILTVVEDSTTEEVAEIVTNVVEDLSSEDATEIVTDVVSDLSVEETTEVVTDVVADRPVEEAAEMVADIIVDEKATDAAEIILGVIEERPVEEKVEIIQAQTTENAAATLDEIVIDDAVEIMDSIIPTVEELEDATEEEQAEIQVQVEAAAEMMNEVEPEKAAEVLLESTSSEKAKTIVEEMAKADIEKAAIRLEDAVKIQQKTGEITAEQKTAYRKQLKEIVQAGDPQAMADLFVAIANLPNTPSTVAEIFEIIDIENAMTIIDIVSAQGSHEELALVYSFLSDAKLTEIWTAMTSAVRTAVYPYFDAATLGNLPELTTFTVSMSVSPDTVETGDPVTVTATVSNTGDETGDIWVTMTEGSTEESEVVTLDAGASTTLTWTITKASAGSYTVDVNGDSASFTVEAPPTPAAFTLSNLSVSPASIQAGEDVTVTVDVENTGEESGSTTVEVELDGVEADSELVTLNGGASTTVSFTVTSETEGVHTVDVGDLSEDFTVEEAPAGFPWTYVAIAVVIIAAAAYFYMQQQEQD